MKFVTSVLTALSLTTCTSAFLPSLIERNTQSTQLFGTRTPIISGNWKLNPQTKEEAITLATEISEGITSESPDCEVALFVPYVFIEAAIAACDGKLSVGAEVGYFSNLFNFSLSSVANFCHLTLMTISRVYVQK